MKPSSLAVACSAIITLTLGSYFLNFPSEWWKAEQPDADQEITVRLVQPRRVSLPRRIKISRDRPRQAAVDRPRRVSLPRRIKISGELRPEREVDLVSRLGGKVTAVRVKVGDFVKAGDLIATVKADGLERRINEQEDRIRTAREELRAAQTELDTAEKRAVTQREMVRRDLISRRDFEQVENAAETSRARVELAQARLAQYEAMFAQLAGLRSLSQIVAAMGGQVSRVYAKSGSWVGERGAIATLVDPGKLKLIEEVTEDGVRQLRSGNSVQISSPELPGVIAQGKVSRLQPLSDGGAGRYVVEIALANPLKVFRPGMAVDAWIAINTHEVVLLIPRSAIASEDKRTSVFKISAELALRQEVKIGREFDDEVEVIEGLTDRDAVLVEFPKSLKSGSRVRAQSS